MVSGRVNVPIALNESVIKEVWGGQAAGCNIIAFNARSFESYGKHERQGENAPVSVQASFAYTTALNHLLRKGSPQRIQVGDASTVFGQRNKTRSKPSSVMFSRTTPIKLKPSMLC